MIAPQRTEVWMSARPEVTTDLMTRTSLDERILTRLVHSFYDKVRADPILAPVFAEHVSDWGPHLAKMVDFWSSVALMTGRYHGLPMHKHFPLPVEQLHFDRWLILFRETAHEVCSPEGAHWVTSRAEQIAFSIHAHIQRMRTSDTPNI
ncbi:MAG: group III truncated hemoglobin [Aestuariivirga sp.]|jgi:hemoglobin